VIAAINIAIHLTVWNTSVEATLSRLEGPLRQTAAEVSARLGFRTST
jgi:IclR family pca regulon transcriptional regulator